MKKVFYFAAALAALVLGSCSKEMNPGGEIPASGRTINLTINDDAALKSSFDGAKIALAGNEAFRICYVDGTGKIAGTMKASGTEGNYTFTVPGDLAVEDYTWYAIGPWKQYNDGKGEKLTNLQNISSEVLTSRIPAVQTPGANTFDPAADVVISNGFTVSSGAATINRFKRISAPLLIKVTGLEDTEKIYAAALSVESSNGLSSKATIAFSGTFANAGVASNDEEFANVAAVWQDGLAKGSGYWPVWFCVNPTTVSAGASLTLTVTTGTRTITRTVSASEMEFLSDKINTFGFNIAGTGNVVKKTIAQGWMTEAVNDSLNVKGNPTLTASDGNTYAWATWRAGNCTKASGYTFDGIVSYALMTSAYSGTFKGVKIPLVSGHLVKGVTCYMHPATINNSHYLLVYPADAVAKGTDNYIAYGKNNGAFASLQAPVSTSLSGLKMCCNNTDNIVMTVLEIEENAVVSDDYKEIYDNGGDIKIGNLTINKVSNPNSEVVKVEKIAKTTFSDVNKVYFVDNTDSAGVVLSTGCQLKGIIIGRYRTSQPSIKSEATGTTYFNLYNGSSIKNLYLEIGSSGMFVPSTEGKGATTSVNIEDCTLVYTGDGQVFRESQTSTTAGKEKSFCFNDITVSNSIIQTNKSLLGNNSTARTKDYPYGAGMEGTITLTNNVIMPVPGASSVTSVSVPLFDAKTSAYSGMDQTFNVVMRNNTLYYFRMKANGGIISAQSIRGIYFDSNLIYTDVYAAEQNNTRIIKCNVNQSAAPSPVSFTNNWGNKAYQSGTTTYSYLAITYSSTAKYWNADDHESELSYVNTGNSWKNTANPFATGANPLIGYLPVDSSVTTAGAVYTTKLWRNWTTTGGGSEPLK